jgi:hypothetical protein
MDGLGSLCPVLADIVDNLFEIVAVVIFLILSAIGNVVKNKAEKMGREDSEKQSRQSQAAARPKPLGPAERSRQMHRLPYAKISEKPRPEPLSSQQKPSQKTQVVKAQTLPASDARPNMSHPAKAPKPAASVHPKPEPTAAKPEKTGQTSEKFERTLRQMLRNPKQIRSFVVAAEILDKPLALR